MTKEEIVLLQKTRSRTWVKRVLDFHKQNIEYIKKSQNIEKNVQAIYHYVYDLTEKQRCKICNEFTTFNTHKFSYNEFCSKSCVGKNNKNRKIKNKKNVTSKEYIENVKNENVIEYKEAKQRLIDFIDNHNYDFANIIKKMYKEDKELLNTIYSKYEFENRKQSEIYYRILNEIEENPKCIYCNDKVNFKGFFDGYSLTCTKCSNKLNLYKKRWKQWFKIKEKIEENEFEILTSQQCYAYHGGYIERKCKNGHITKSHISNIYQRNACRICFTSDNQSKPEKEIVNFLEEHELDIVENNRQIIPPYELDIYIPEKKIAIEYCGLYWHSLKEKGYHLNKYNLCKEKNIQLLQIFEDEWINDKDIVKSIILSKLGLIDKKIYARKCEVGNLSLDEYRDFCNKNHIQGYAVANIRLGLFYKDELVCIMSLGKRKITGGKSELEIIRFCNKKFTNVIGGASKLLSHIDINTSKIVTYTDKRYSNGKLYEKLGFKLVRESTPNFWYIKNQERYNRIGFQKHKLEKLLTEYDENLTSNENMINNGYSIVYDCGQLIFERNI